MKIFRSIFIFSIILIFIGLLILGISMYINTNKKVYYAKDFGIEVIKSDKDYNNNGIDDYTDILNGAKIDAKNKPEYKNAYYAGGYPPENEGVCTDLVWRALKNAGYILKDMIDEDIKNNVSKYPRVEGKQDTNIDFRRVGNVKTYFERNGIILTKDLNDIKEWQPGDIVTFGISHIGIISDKRNEKGIPYLLHNGGQFDREEDVLEIYNSNTDGISGHFRLK